MDRHPVAPQGERGPPYQALERLRAMKPRFRDMNIKRLRVFGSVARRDAEASSDIDLLVEFYETPGLIEFAGLKRQLEEELGIAVDLVTPRGLHWALRDRVLAEATDV